MLMNSKKERALLDTGGVFCNVWVTAMSSLDHEHFFSQMSQL